LFILIVAAGVFLLFGHEQLFDWIAERNYHPTAVVQQLTADTTMTPQAKHLFYVNRPVIENKDGFNKHCTNGSDQVSTLGCFTGNRLGIYVYNVTDPRLAGVQQVTAAHEMLHQAYERLSQAERTRIDALLQHYYTSGLTDQTIRDQLQTYVTTEPGQLTNEMHSILGTEVTALPPELETYYARYFNDRARVARYYQQYQSAFNQRNQQIKDYDTQLDSLKMQIDANRKDLSSRQAVLLGQRNQLDAYKSSGRIIDYNNLVPSYNDLVNAYRGEIDETNNLINQYNQMLGERNAIAVQERQLQSDLDSHVVTSAPTQ